MKSITYFYINNVKFNYTLEFQNNYINDYWKQNAPLIEYCETVGVDIPHYCYHKNLSISGNCRMCLVELKNAPKPIVSCAMSAKSCLNNSEIFTNSPLVKKARENVLEFLLLNHPLDCPICDQGGECDLQDQSFFFGISKKRFYNFKRVVTDKNIGPIVKTVMTRCIHCTRCVRFACEIAGTEDLGMFGRGLDSEIGTYVTKTFQSELSGNVIDLCPVGALTSKPYPFVSRSWELKNLNSIDFSDGFCSDIQVYLKNNHIIKVTPEYKNQNNSWISDKTRFAFDGMFSPEKILKGFIKAGNNKLFITNTWKLLLQEIILTLYFQDHLNKHFFKINKMLIIFDNNVNIEVINLLNIFSVKYSFIKLRKANSGYIETDLEQNFLTTKSNELVKNLNQSNVCFLLGFNSRYESSSLNTLLRKRVMKGDFKIFSMSSSNDLTFPVSYLGLNIKTLKQISEGNHKICQELSYSKTTFLIGSHILQRKDAKGLINVLNKLKLKAKNSSILNGFNIINSSVNEAGVNYLNTFKPVTENDIKSNAGLYFLNQSSKNSNIQKIINLKLLNYIPKNDFLPNFCLEQNNGISCLNQNVLESACNIYNYINLPNNSFFESNGTYLNTEGSFKKTVKFVSTNKQTKDDWQILRKIFSVTKKIDFTTNQRNNTIRHFNSKNLIQFKNFAGFLFSASKNIVKKNYNYKLADVSLSNKTTPFYYLKLKKTKIINSKLKIWINDFYIGGKDPYSKYSTTMINCSRIFRTEKHNFTHVN